MRAMETNKNFQYLQECMDWVNNQLVSDITEVDITKNFGFFAPLTYFESYGALFRSEFIWIFVRFFAQNFFNMACRAQWKKTREKSNFLIFRNFS